MLTAQKRVWVLVSRSFIDPKGGGAAGRSGEYVQQSPPSTMVLPRPNARLATPPDGPEPSPG
jgi:hypothetical protein